VIKPCQCTKPPLGGLSRRAALMKELGRDGVPTVVIDAGDSFYPVGSGQTLAMPALFQKKAALIAEYFRKVGADAVALGEGDLLYGLEGLKFMEGDPAFPLVSSNVRPPDAGPAWATRQRCRVGPSTIDIVSAIDQETFQRLGLGAHGVRFEPPAEGVRNALEAGPASDFAVFCSHLSSVDDLHGMLARFPKIKIMIDARHVFVMKQTAVTKTCFIVAPPLAGTYVTVLDLFLAPTPAEASWQDLEKIDSLLHMRSTILEQRRRSPAGTPGTSLDAQLARLDAQVEGLGRELSTKNVVRVSQRAVSADVPQEREVLGLESRLEEWIQSHAQDLLLPQNSPLLPSESASSCGACHPRELEAWSRTKHAHALETLAPVQGLKNPECLSCHVSGYLRRGGPRTESEIRTFGAVQCISCHRVEASHSRRPAESVRTKVSPATCLPCHNRLQSPAFNYDLYLPRASCQGTRAAAAAPGAASPDPKPSATPEEDPRRVARTGTPEQVIAALGSVTGNLLQPEAGLEANLVPRRLVSLRYPRITRTALEALLRTVESRNGGAPEWRLAHLNALNTRAIYQLPASLETPSLASLLKAGDAPTQDLALMLLAEQRSSGVLDLARERRSSGRNVRAALYAFGEVGGEAEARELSRLLGDPALQSAALQALQKLRSPSVLEEVAALLAPGESGAPANRAGAVSLLARPEARNHGKDLLALAGERFPIGPVAIEALGSMRAVEHKDFVARLTAHSDPKTRLAALKALKDLGSAEDGRRLEPLLAHPDPATRAAALEALQVLGDRGSAAAAAALLKDPAPSVRAAAIRCLGTWGSAGEWGAVTASASVEKEPRVLGAIARYLLCVPGKDAERRGVLLKLLSIDDPETRFRVLYELNALSAPRAFSRTEAPYGAASSNSDSLRTRRPELERVLGLPVRIAPELEDRADLGRRVFAGGFPAFSIDSLLINGSRLTQYEIAYLFKSDALEITTLPEALEFMRALLKRSD
jgi:HEAT repeat protein